MGRQDRSRAGPQGVRLQRRESAQSAVERIVEPEKVLEKRWPGEACRLRRRSNRRILFPNAARGEAWVSSRAYEVRQEHTDVQTNKSVWRTKRDYAYYAHNA